MRIPAPLKTLFMTISVSALLSSCAVENSSEAQSVSQSSATLISGASIAARIERLASDDFLGRPPSGPGADKTLTYISGQMKEAGLKPMGDDNSYFQDVTLTQVIAKDTSFAAINTGTEKIALIQGENAVFWTKQYNESTQVQDSELVFVGYGISAPEYNWDDYSGIDVRGKTVVMLVNDPGFVTKNPDLFNGESMTYYGRWTYKYEQAAKMGAAGAILIHEEKPASYPWSVVSGSWTGEQFDLVRSDKGMSLAQLEGWVTREQAVQLFTASGLNFETLKTTAARRGFKAVPMSELTLSAQINNAIKETTSRNVAGAVIGSKHPDEYVLYMGHWDHLGMSETAEGTDKIFNGAVDNATGTAAILEIGEAFAQGPQPERSVLILAVTAEESGLLGSAHYADNPLVPLEKTVAGINIDAIYPIGETRDIIVVGYGASELEDRLKVILEKDNKYIVPDQTPSAGFYYRSDHISLAKKGVPMLYADSGLDHLKRGKDYGKEFSDAYVKNRYHMPSDEYSADWDMSGIEATSRIFYNLGMNIANTKDWPEWYETSEFKTTRDEMLK